MPQIIVPSVNSPTWVTSDADTPPASPNGMDDEFSGSVLDAKWSWLNQGTSTGVVGNNQLTITHTAPNNSDNFSGLHQPCPSGNWAFRMKHVYSGTYANFWASCLYVHDSANGRIVAWGPGITGVGSTSLVFYMTNTTTYNTSPANDGRIQGVLMIQPHYLEIEYNGTSLIFRNSWDGINWMTAASISATAWITNRSNIGLGHYVSTTTTTAVQGISWFRRYS